MNDVEQLLAKRFPRFLNRGELVFVNAILLLLDVNNRVVIPVFFFEFVLEFIEIELLTEIC